MKLVIGVGGGIGAGKSAFARGLAARIGAVTTSFGDVVRDEAKARGLDPSSRDVLQAVGEQLKRNLGDRGFVERVLDRASDAERVVVDGVRHVEVAEAIAEVIAPCRFRLVFLDVTTNVRRERVTVRGDAGPERLETWREHSTERQVHDGSLLQTADVVLDGREPIDDLIAAAVLELGLH